VKRTAPAILVLVAVLAGCGSSGGGPSTQTSAPLTPAAYRTKVNALCTEAKTQLGSTSMQSVNSQADAIAAVDKAIGIFQPILTTAESLTPPAPLAPAHAKLVESLTTLVNGGQELVAKLKDGTPVTKALTADQVQSFSKAFTGMKQSFTKLGLATCTQVISGG
jgi:hypothetical protein